MQAKGGFLCTPGSPSGSATGLWCTSVCVVRKITLHGSNTKFNDLFYITCHANQIFTARACTHSCTHVYVCTRTHMHVHTHMHAHTHTQAHTHTVTCIYMHTLTYREEQEVGRQFSLISVVQYRWRITCVVCSSWVLRWHILVCRSSSFDCVVCYIHLVRSTTKLRTESVPKEFWLEYYLESHEPKGLLCATGLAVHMARVSDHDGTFSALVWPRHFCYRRLQLHWPVPGMNPVLHTLHCTCSIC